MPLSKLFQYAHCALLYAGCATRWKHGDPEGDERFRRWLARMKEHEREAREAASPHPTPHTLNTDPT